MWYSLHDLDEVEPGKLLAHITAHDHSPWFSGHFPENPILPGIAQVDMIVAVINRLRQKPLTLQRLNRVKFKKIIKPDEILEIQTTYLQEKNQFSFRITSAEEEVCTGMMTLI